MVWNKGAQSNWGRRAERGVERLLLLHPLFGLLAVMTGGSLLALLAGSAAAAVVVIPAVWLLGWG